MFRAYPMTAAQLALSSAPDRQNPRGSRGLPLRNLLLGAALALPFAMTPAIARAEPSHVEASRPEADPAAQKQARALVREAGQLLESGDKQGAVAKLLAAQRLRPDPSIDYNLGITYAELHDDPRSAQALARFLRDADRSAVLADRIDDAEKRVAAYKKSLARLELRVALPPSTPDGAPPPAVFIDDESRGPLKTGPAATSALWLKPGAHRVRVTAPYAREYAVSVEVKPGEQRALSGELLAANAGQSLVPSNEYLQAQSEAEKPPVYKKWWFWTAVGGGAAVAIGLIAAGAAGRFTRIAPGSDLDPVEVGR